MRKMASLPTGKSHISFSEVKDWHDCTYRHRLKYVQKIGEFVPGPALTFGTALHDACEDFLKTRVMKPELAQNATFRQRFLREVGVDARRADANQDSEVVRVEAFGRAHGDRAECAQAVADEVGVHRAGGEDHRNAGEIRVLAFVGENDVAAAG